MNDSASKLPRVEGARAHPVPRALLVVSLAALGACSHERSPVTGAPDAGGTASATRPNPTESARRAVATWTDALNRHDAAALAGLYEERVRYYGHEMTKTRALRDKSAALAKVRTFHQEIVGPIAVQGDGARFVASFVKRSGPAGKLREVGAKLVLVPHDSVLLIAEETDDPSEEPAEQRRRERCEAVAAELVEGLPDVKKSIAAINAAVDKADSGAVYGGVGPIEDGLGGFQAGLGVHTSERFEEIVSYQVDNAGWLTVSTGGGDIALPSKARAAVRRACKEKGAPRSCSAKRGPNESEEDAMLAALFPQWDAKSRRAKLAGNEQMRDCFGNTSNTSWSGDDVADASLSAGQVRIKGRQALDGDRAFYFVATGFEASACAGENGFLVLAHASGTKEKVEVEASSPWSATCEAEFSLRALPIRGGTVYQENAGSFGTGAGHSEDDPVWVIDPPQLRIARTFSIASDPDCPMTDDQQCESSVGELRVSDAGTLEYRETTTTQLCSLATDGGAPVCRDRRTKVETGEYVLEEGALVAPHR